MPRRKILLKHYILEGPLLQPEAKFRLLAAATARILILEDFALWGSRTPHEPLLLLAPFR